MAVSGPQFPVLEFETNILNFKNKSRYSNLVPGQSETLKLLHQSTWELRGMSDGDERSNASSDFCSRLLEEIMRDTPGFPIFIREKLCTSHIEYLPSIEPHGSIILPISLFQMRPNVIFIPIHLCQPILDD